MNFKENQDKLICTTKWDSQWRIISVEILDVAIQMEELPGTGHFHEEMQTSINTYSKDDKHTGLVEPANFYKSPCLHSQSRRLCHQYHNHLDPIFPLILCSAQG